MGRFFVGVIAVIAFLWSQELANAQATQGVKGIVLDAETRQPLPLVQIIVTRLPDSLVVARKVTEVNGSFELSLENGQYEVQHRYVGYLTKREQISIDGNWLDLGLIMLQPEAVDLDALIVQAARDALEIQPDKKVILVDRLQNVAGGSLSEVLTNLPGLTADQDGKISIRGSDRVRILINGRESALTGEQSADFLQQIPAEAIEKIEIITNPSARYDAMASMGIINIILKKQTGTQTSGSVTATGAYEQDHAISGFVRGFTSGVRWDATANVRYNRTENLHTILRRDFTGNSSPEVDQRRVYSRDGVLQNYGLGVERAWNEQHNTEVRANLQLSDRWRDDNTAYHFTNENERYNYGIDTDELKRGFDLSLSHKLQLEKRDLTFLVAHSQSEETNTMDALLRSIQAATPLHQTLPQHQRIDEAMQVVQVDYTMALTDVWKMSAGGKFTHRTMESLYRLKNVPANTDLGLFTLPVDGAYTYDESITAGYVVSNYVWNNTSFELGARYQFTQLELPGTSGVVPTPSTMRSFKNVFWSGQVVQQLTDMQQVRLAFNQRMNLPASAQLNPNVAFKDLLNIRRGNAFLQPEFSDKIELGYNVVGAKQSVELSVYRMSTEAVIQRLREVDTDGVVYESFGNLASEVQTGFEVVTNREVLPWWKVEWAVNGYYVQTDGQNLRPEFEREYWAVFSLLTNNITLPGKTFLQFTHFYSSPLFTVQGKMAALQNLDISLRKDFGTSSTFTVRASDIFDTRRFDFLTDTQDLYLDNRYKRLTRRLYATYTYRFNNYKAASKKKKMGEGIEELKDF